MMRVSSRFQSLKITHIHREANFSADAASRRANAMDREQLEWWEEKANFIDRVEMPNEETYRKQGHGEALLRAAIEKCRTRNIRRICLHVDPLRSSAVNLYQKTGFKIDELIKCYYSADRDAYKMYLDFGDA